MAQELLKMVTETATRAEILEERFDRHLNSIEKKMDQLAVEVGALKTDLIKGISGLQIDKLEDDKMELKDHLRLWGPGGVSGSIGALVVHWLMKLKGQ